MPDLSPIYDWLSALSDSVHTHNEWLHGINAVNAAQQTQLDTIEATQTELMTAIIEHQEQILQVATANLTVMQVIGGFLLGALIAIAVIMEMKKW